MLGTDPFLLSQDKALSVAWRTGVLLDMLFSVDSVSSFLGFIFVACGLLQGSHVAR